MKKPEFISWEVTTNENGVKMATMNRGRLVKIIEYIKFLESKLEKAKL